MGDPGESGGLLELLQRPRLPAGFERWRVELGAGRQHPTDAAEWAGAMVLIEQGELEVECLAGGSRTFGEGDLLVLGWLPLRRLRNVGPRDVRLLAVRPVGRRPKDALLRVFRAHRRTSCDDFAPVWRSLGQ
ncbi:MAG TPA: hypothetical protein VMP67_03740 [Candidatus Limnocylindria bacterium]|nr:hypothetical protein [Candidatus Limnocylindria bacterium]